MTPHAAPHLIVIGDNQQALAPLADEFRGAIDGVYIDPPYDHGDGGRRGSQRMFAYADRRADWTGFMRDRLELVKPLLSPSAAVAISIGHRRLHELAILLADVFDGWEVVTITVDLRNAPADRIGVQRSADYLLIAVPQGIRLGAPGLTKGETRNGWSGFGLSGFTADDYPNQVYDIWVDPDSHRILGAGPSVRQRANGVERPEMPAGALVIEPLTRAGKLAVWRNSREKFDELHAAGHIRAQRPHMPGNVQAFTIQYVTTGTRKRISAGEIQTHGVDERGALLLDRVDPAGSGVPAVWAGEGFETRAGSARLEELIGPGHGFAYPKSVRLVSDAIQTITGGRKDAVILDFFAGSGTTLDAVVHLNSVDGGSRQAILVQLDEGDIVDRVLLPRAGAVTAQAGTSYTLRREPDPRA